MVAGNCSVGLLWTVSLSFAAAVSFSGDAKYSRAFRKPPETVSAINNISDDATSKNRVEMGQTTHAGLFSEVRAQSAGTAGADMAVCQCYQAKKSPTKRFSEYDL